MIIGTAKRPLVGKVFPVSWDAALALRDLGVAFFLLIVNDGTLGDLLEKTLVNFIRHHKLPFYVVKVSIVDYSEAASRLCAVYIPQVRFYKNGDEIGRHRGLATYEILNNVIKT